MNVHLVSLDKIEQQVQRAFKDFKPDFVIVGFHRAALVVEDALGG
jgi:hypothetical protein